jgi:hypothetical protein
VQGYTHPASILLTDSLSATQGEANQGVWCTMGLGARTALLIGTDGTIQYKQDWFNSDDTSAAIDAYLAKTSTAAAAHSLPSRHSSA